MTHKSEETNDVERLLKQLKDETLNDNSMQMLRFKEQ